MKITCQACAAKYTIADDKVLGKIVKIRCKKCGATIVVNGNDPSASAGAAGSAADAPRAFDYTAQGAQGEPWTVNVADGDQRTMTEVEIADAYHAGVVSDETFCWKDGMTDWLPLREIEQLYAACTSTRAAASPSAAPSPDEGVTKVQQTGPSIFGSSPAPAPAAYAAPRPAAAAAPAAGNGTVAAQASPAAAAPAARRAGARAPAADLFSGAAQAGGEDDVMTSAPAGMPELHDDPQRLTGARNENSVLFSLNALTSKSPSPSNRPMTASAEASGLIDIRNLGAQIGLGEDKKKSRIDDIMNLAGGGAFSPSLGAPVLSAPPVEEYAPAAPEATGPRAAVVPIAGKSKAVIFGAIGAGIVVIVGAIGAAVMLMGGKSDTADNDKAAASGTAATMASVAAATPSATGTDSAASSAAPPPDSASAATSAAPTATTTAKAAKADTTKPKDTAAAAKAETKPKETETPATPPAFAAPPPAEKPAAAGGSDQPFNMGEAKARLASIAGSVQACKKGDLSGSGRVVVTFAPGGNVQSAVVSGPPFEGTPTGACVASHFRGAHVPAFSGSPFSVSKSFTIN
jgi:predicted Zn finger-like uncharacterized protein